MLGPGFLEIIYRRALVIELNKHGLATEIEKGYLSITKACDWGSASSTFSSRGQAHCRAEDSRSA
ncbi:MAG: GxxExxY protein [Gemmatimonadota bacterium]